MAIARANAPSARVVVGRATRRLSRVNPNVSSPDDRPKPCDDAAADFVGWARDVGVISLGGTAADGARAAEADGAAIRLQFGARQDFKAAFFECLKTGATVIEHPRHTDDGDLAAKLLDPDGYLWDLTAPS